MEDAEMRKKVIGEDGFPLKAEASAGPNLTVRNDDALREKIAALKDFYEGERMQALSISDVVRAAVFKAYADIKAVSPPPPTSPPAPVVPPYSECNQCEEAEGGKEYKCCKCGRGLKATMLTDLMIIQGTAKEVDPLAKPAKKPAKKQRKAKE